MSAIDYLLIGHITTDLTPAGPKLGGTVSFAALVAQALGHRTGILTSAATTIEPLLDPLKGIELIRIPAEHTTTFENVYSSTGRKQILHAQATVLQPTSIPAHWQEPSIVHLAPVANEVPSEFAGYFSSALTGATPQGWMRQWDRAGQVSYRAWENAVQQLKKIDAVAMSIEDVQGDEGLVNLYAQHTRILIITRGAAACTLYLDGEKHHITVPRVKEVDPTGAGDIFATAFFIRLHATADPLRAARFAALLASDSVTRSGVDSLPQRDRIEEALLLT